MDTRSFELPSEEEDADGCVRSPGCDPAHRPAPSVGAPPLTRPRTAD
jgi:hypothetical protein